MPRFKSIMSVFAETQREMEALAEAIKKAAADRGMDLKIEWAEDSFGGAQLKIPLGESRHLPKAANDVTTCWPPDDVHSISDNFGRQE